MVYSVCMQHLLPCNPPRFGAGDGAAVHLNVTPLQHRGLHGVLICMQRLLQCNPQIWCWGWSCSAPRCHTFAAQRFAWGPPSVCNACSSATPRFGAGDGAAVHLSVTPLQHRGLHGKLHLYAMPAAMQPPDLVLGMELQCTPKLHLCSTEVCMGSSICM